MRNTVRGMTTWNGNELCGDGEWEWQNTEWQPTRPKLTIEGLQYFNSKKDNFIGRGWGC
jgi:hypothetical protein